MILPVSVTARHIEMGCPGDSADCPVWHAIADALREHLPQVAHRLIGGLVVGPAQFHFGDGASITHSDKAAAWIYAFDDGQRVAPVAFEIEIPDDLIGAAA